MSENLPNKRDESLPVIAKKLAKRSMAFLEDLQPRPS